MTRVPPLYLACAVMFWAWHAKVLVLGVAMAVALEAPRIVSARWSFGAPEFARIADLCTYAFAILVGYITFTKGVPIRILQIFTWLPLVWLPLMAAQLFSAAGRMPLAALFLMLRPGKHAARTAGSIDLGYLYAAACAISAGAANARANSYYAGLLVLAAWALWQVRSPRYSLFVWVPMMAGTGALGYAGHLGLAQLQQIVMESTGAYFGGGARTDPYRSTTDIGQIGELKQSDRIMLRVTLPLDVTAPVLLHRASYNAYASPTWLARDVSFFAVSPEPDDSTWVLPTANRAEDVLDAGGVSRIEVAQTIERGKAVLALPNGTVRIEQLPLLGMQRNLLGTVTIESHEDLAIYQAAFRLGAGLRDAPRDTDLKVPRQEAATLDQLIARMQLKGRPAGDVLTAVRDYFARDFAYSTYLSARQSQGTPLADFLLVTRAGHCEYFATATVLLLRAAGVPARYATGYSVQEWSPLEKNYIVRERHAHAWARAWVDGQWIDFDTTPPVWFSAEAQDAPRTQRVTDLWSWTAYRYARWKSEDSASLALAALILVGLLAAILVWRLLIRKPLAVRRASRASAAAKHTQPGADSEFYQIEARLIRAGCARAPHEPLSTWLMRVGRERADIGVRELQELLRLHYRYRFDPCGLSGKERAALTELAQRWLLAHPSLRRGDILKLRCRLIKGFIRICERRPPPIS